MKIVTWNCNGALRKKFEKLEEFDAEVLIVQECENPEFVKEKLYRNWANNYLWIGDNKNKGVGVFAKPEIRLKKLDWSNSFRNSSVKYFLPCNINNQFNLLAVWTHYNNSPNFRYIGQFWKYMQINKPLFNNILIAGDFNSNSCWDQWDRWWNHTDVVKELKEIGVESVYHHFKNEEQGNESLPTFFLQRKLNKPYHIDYFFAGSELLSNLKSISVEQFENWKHLSDHCPLVLEFKD
jgi:exonuclease III